jgi:hypothetical protein
LRSRTIVDARNNVTKQTIPWIRRAHAKEIFWIMDDIEAENIKPPSPEPPAVIPWAKLRFFRTID